ncbi:MAG: EAL domain-containing protein, partial [Gammaproteobacteria bacterium]
RDITERKRTEASMSFRAHHDLLTRLPNRALLRDRLELAIAHAERNKGRIAVMFLDLDGFKHVNDTCGHATGDRLLQAVAARLRDCLRRGDTLARLGGDEFTLVSPEPGNDAGVRAIAEKILERLGRPFQVDGHNLQLGSSIGIATFPETGRTHDELLRNADAAMYQVKSGGKHGYCFFSPGMEPPSSMRPALQHELLEALSRNELEVFYQPQVCLRTGHVVGLESFVRWRHPQRGLLVADSFLPAIDDGALAVLIDRFALTRALHDAVGWLRTDARFQRLALNVSAASLRDEEAVDTLLQAVARARIDPATIVFELAEHELVREQDVLPSQLRRLRAAGMKITLDGFGLGYAPLTLLEDLPLDMLKLPGALTASISRDTASSQAVRAVLGMARALGARVVAEGVEYPYQLHYLAAQGCAEAQGHLLGAAVPAAHARKLLDGRPLPTWPLRDDAGTGAA